MHLADGIGVQRLTRPTGVSPNRQFEKSKRGPPFGLADVHRRPRA
jgi:hypothetical protein